MINVNHMENIALFCPPEPKNQPLRCIFCGDDELAHVRNLKGHPVYYSKGREYLYVCGCCGDEQWL